MSDETTSTSAHTDHANGRPTTGSPADRRIWLRHYAAHRPADITLESGTILDMFAATLERSPDASILRYFDRSFTARELDALTDAFAAGILAGGFAPGERIAIFAQNTPLFVIAQLGTWKAGGIAVSINPMYRERELAELLADSGATVLVTHDDLHRDVAAGVVGAGVVGGADGPSDDGDAAVRRGAVGPDGAGRDGIAVRQVITASALEFQTRDDPRVLGGTHRVDPSEIPGATDLLGLLDRFAGQAPPPAAIGPDDVAVLTYTSGTTGPPKGAMSTHRNVVFNAHVYRDWIGIDDSDVILGIAPLFHVTGLLGHVALSLLTGAPLVLMHRLDPALTIETIRDEQVTFTVGSITVFIALMNVPDARREDLASLTTVFSGGAPIPPSTVEAFHSAFGLRIHNMYGLTETTGPTHATPMGASPPVDEASGALSVGVPVYGTVVRVVDDAGRELPPGEIGEIVSSGPQVVAGYWNRPEETAEAMGGGDADGAGQGSGAEQGSEAGLVPGFRTGDVGYMDAEGWFYIVDRKKDQINAGGFKVWPREVEDVLYEHAAVREAAVVGVPDDYRGETVKAFVSLRPDAHATPEELIAFCKERMAAFKYPRQVEILDEIPKTVTGKLLRRELRG